MDIRGGARQRTVGSEQWSTVINKRRTCKRNTQKRKNASGGKTKKLLAQLNGNACFALLFTPSHSLIYTRSHSITHTHKPKRVQGR